MFRRKIGKIQSKFYEKYYIPFLNKVKKPNKDAIWVFGLQKAGTSAIAGLIAHMSDSTISLDPRCLWSPYGKRIREGKLSVEEHVNRFSYPFSKDIIKEPSTTFYIEKIESYFSLRKYIFIIRNPYSNIRSILNRLDLPGDKKRIDIKDVHPDWRNKFKGEGEDYIKDLAELWLEANSQDYYQFNERCILVKYEDFKQDKVNFIKNICHQLDLPIRNSIDKIMDRPFQPRGNADVDLTQFFGDKNLKIISKVCDKRMREFGFNKKEILNL